MTHRRPYQYNGFTLVELLVALFIFSLISLAGLTLLRSSADGQVAIKNRLAQHSDLVRTANLLEADLAQAVARPSVTIAATAAAPLPMAQMLGHWARFRADRRSLPSPA
ncbi:MAG: prepilin-type N-terminal cleavage/methylation domain-containing protein [Sphingomonadales bacterium]|nr:prepilin-type N-terminal cleavage/methylation domain-containing protein [Sphingomonadales bacterium]